MSFNLNNPELTPGDRGHGTYVTAATIYVEGATSPEDAEATVHYLNDLVNASCSGEGPHRPIVQIRLPDETKWELVDVDSDDDDYMKGMTPDEYAAWQESWRK